MLKRTFKKRRGADPAVEAEAAAVGELLAAGEPAAALTRATALVAAHPDAATGHLLQGRALHDLGRHADALGAFDRSTLADSTDADAHNRRADALLHLGRNDEAVIAAERCAALGRSAETTESVLHALAASGRWPELLEAADAALATFGEDHAQLHGRRAQALVALDRDDEALVAANACLDLEPARRDMYVQQFRVLVRRADWEGALEVASIGTIALPDSGYLSALRARALFELGRHEEALASEDRAIELEPALADAHRRRADILDALGRTDEAARARGRALELSPDAGHRVVSSVNDDLIEG